MITPPVVLFVCVHNAGRSQMAAAYLTALSAGRVDVRSAGSTPADAVNPTAVAAMLEEGIDLSAEVPKLLSAEAVRESDVVVTMGCGDTCPFFPGKRYEDWELDDPAGQGIDAVRAIRDDIRARVVALLAELLPEDPEPPVVVIGAGPVGLAAAAHLIERRQAVRVLEAGAGAGAALSEWGHVRLFSPWQYNTDAAARRLLAGETGVASAAWNSPEPSQLPTGAELIAEYLAPLAAHPKMAPHLSYGHRVVAITRVRANGTGVDKTSSVGRERTLFLIRVETESGPAELLARAVIDASGTWHTPNPVGRSGVPAPGEAAARLAGVMTEPLPDPEGADRERFAGKRILVLGAGHSAANTLIALARVRAAHPDTQILWGVRGEANPVRLYGGGAADELPARGALGTTLRDLVAQGDITLIERVSVAGVGAGDQLTVSLADGRELLVDLLVPATGFRPDLAPLAELRLDLDQVVEAPRALAPLIDPESHSCGTVAAHGERLLVHPEPGFYIVGMKSYGRAPTFLMATGYEQVRSIAAALAGDRAAADRVELELPETGVCAVDRNGLGEEAEGSCGTAEPAADGCCAGPESVTIGFATGTLHGHRERLDGSTA